MKKTILFTNEQSALLTRVSLPGYTKYFPLKPEMDFNIHNYWKKVVEILYPLSRKTRTPLMFVPYLFVENIVRSNRKNEAVIEGVEPNSPAEFAGINVGDVVLKVNGQDVVSRSHAKEAILITKMNEVLNLIIRRNDKYFNVSIDPEKHFKNTGYPYFSHNARGILMPSGLRLGPIIRMFETIKKMKAKEILLLVSELMFPSLNQALEEVITIPENISLHIEIPKQGFWGGNIIINDLLIVQDYIDHINDFIRRNTYKPDIVFIPNSGFTFNRAGGWQRDCQGGFFGNIERITGIKVQPIESEIIFY